MSTFSVTASGNSCLRTGFYGHSWRTDSSGSAYQGTYRGSDTTAPYPRVGVILFNGAGSALNGKNISSITLTTKASGSGNSGSKTLYIRKSNYQSINTSYSPASYVGDSLGTLTGTFYGNTSTFTLNSSSNVSLFYALKSYLEAGNSVITIYTGESTSSTWSSNYLGLTSVTINVTYTDGGYVRIYNGSSWDKYIPYIYDGSNWVRYAPYVYDGSNWSQYGG